LYRIDIAARRWPPPTAPKKGGEAREVIDRNHRYLTPISRLVETHSHLDILENQNWRWLG